MKYGLPASKNGEDDMTTPIEKETVATVHYTGTLPEDGSEFDSSKGGDPLSYLVGHNQMIPGFEEEMMGATVGEKRTFTLTPERAYGDRSEEAIQKGPLSQFPEGIEVGTTLIAETDVGPMPITVSAIDGDEVTIDMNHPLAGKALTFEVEVVGVRTASEQEITHGHAHGSLGQDH